MNKNNLLVIKNAVLLLHQRDDIGLIFCRDVGSARLPALFQFKFSALYVYSTAHFTSRTYPTYNKYQFYEHFNLFSSLQELLVLNLKAGRHRPFGTAAVRKKEEKMLIMAIQLTV